MINTSSQGLEGVNGIRKFGSGALPGKIITFPSSCGGSNPTVEPYSNPFPNPAGQS